MMIVRIILARLCFFLGFLVIPEIVVIAGVAVIVLCAHSHPISPYDYPSKNSQTSSTFILVLTGNFGLCPFKLPVFIGEQLLHILYCSTM